MEAAVEPERAAVRENEHMAKLVAGCFGVVDAELESGLAGEHVIAVAVAELCMHDEHAEPRESHDYWLRLLH